MLYVHIGCCVDVGAMAMVTNGCHSKAPLCSQTALFILTNHKSPFKSGAAGTATDFKKKINSGQTNIAVPLLLKHFFTVVRKDLESVNVHISVSLLFCVSASPFRQLFFSVITCSF